MAGGAVGSGKDIAAQVVGVGPGLAAACSGKQLGFSSVLRLTIPQSAFADSSLCTREPFPGAGDFSQSPVGVNYGVSGWRLDGDNRTVILSRLTAMRIFLPLTGPHSDEGGVTK